MKRVLAILLVIGMLFTLTSALAERVPGDFIEAVEQILFDTHNMTLSGNAALTLDGQDFKDVHGTYIQDDYRSMTDLYLLNKAEDGTEVDTGYTIVAEDSTAYSLLHYNAGAFRPVTIYPSNVLMTKTKSIEHALGIVNPLLELLLSNKGILTLREDEAQNCLLDLHVNKKNAPLLTNTALNMLYDFVIDKFFARYISQTIVAGRNTQLTDYPTLTEGIVNCTRSVALKELNLTVKMDEEGRITDAVGSGTLILKLTNKTEHELSITLDLTLREYGTSRINLNDYLTLPGNVTVPAA